MTRQQKQPRSPPPGNKTPNDRPKQKSKGQGSKAGEKSSLYNPYRPSLKQTKLNYAAAAKPAASSEAPASLQPSSHDVTQPILLPPVPDGSDSEAAPSPVGTSTDNLDLLDSPSDSVMMAATDSAVELDSSTSSTNPPTPPSLLFSVADDKVSVPTPVEDCNNKSNEASSTQPTNQSESAVHTPDATNKPPSATVTEPPLELGASTPNLPTPIPGAAASPVLPPTNMQQTPTSVIDSTTKQIPPPAFPLPRPASTETKTNQSDDMGQSKLSAPERQDSLISSSPPLRDHSPLHREFRVARTMTLSPLTTKETLQDFLHLRPQDFLPLVPLPSRCRDRYQFPRARAKPRLRPPTIVTAGARTPTSSLRPRVLRTTHWKS